MAKKPTYDSQVIVRCSSNLRKRILKAADSSEKTMTEWIRDTLKERLDYDDLKKSGLAEQKAAYIDGKLIDAIKYALTLPEVQKMIREILGGDKE